MTTERAQEFQMRITEEALALMIIHGESVSDAPSEEDISLAHYEEAVTLIGKAWGLPAEATAENLGLIQREKDVLRRIAAGENVNHILPEEELPMNASGMETLDNVWDLFRGIDFTDLNGDGNSDVTMKFNDGGTEIKMVWFWDTESEQFVYQPDESQLA